MFSGGYGTKALLALTAVGSISVPVLDDEGSDSTELAEVLRRSFTSLPADFLVKRHSEPLPF
jgi:hypothetical protein